MATITDQTQISLTCPTDNLVNEVNCLTNLITQLNGIKSDAQTALNGKGQGSISTQTLLKQFLNSCTAGSVSFSPTGDIITPVATINNNYDYTLSFTDANGKSTTCLPVYTSGMVQQYNTNQQFVNIANNNIAFANTQIPILQGQINTLQADPSYIKSTTSTSTTKVVLIIVGILIVIGGGIWAWIKFKKKA